MFRFLCDNMVFFPGERIITSMDVLSRYWDHRVGGGDGDDFVGFDRGGGFATMAKRIIGHMVKRINL